MGKNAEFSPATRTVIVTLHEEGYWTRKNVEKLKQDKIRVCQTTVVENIAKQGDTGANRSRSCGDVRGLLRHGKICIWKF